MEQNEKITLQKLKKEMEEMRLEYEQKLASVKVTEVPPVASTSKEREAYARLARAQERWLNEYVEIKLFKDNDKYKDDVYVAINGKNCVIRRGVWTRIRRKFALLLDQSEIQDLRTAEMIASESQRFEQATQLRGM